VSSKAHQKSKNQHRKEMKMNANQSKSHKESEIIAAISAGKQLAFLDSGCSGNDDILIMSEGDTLESLQGDIIAWLDNGTNPFETGEWSIRIIECGEIED
jgi:hypothetical protein